MRFTPEMTGFGKKFAESTLDGGKFRVKTVQTALVGPLFPRKLVESTPEGGAAHVAAGIFKVDGAVVHVSDGRINS